MSTETDNIAMLQDDESVISSDNIEAVVESLSSVKDKIKGMPETNDDGVIGSSRTAATGGKKKSAIGQLDGGAMGVKKLEAQEKNKPKPKPAVTKEMVACFSTKNVTWQGVGSISKGYNIFSKSEADKWLTRNHVRLAKPEEVAGEYGV